MSKLGSLAWEIADQPRGPYPQHEYGSVILPMTLLRQVDTIPAPHRQQIAGLIAGVDFKVHEASLVLRDTGLRFRNTSKCPLTGLMQDLDGLRANSVEYLHSSSSTIDVFDRPEFGEVVGCANHSVPMRTTAGKRPCRSVALPSDLKRRDGNL